MKIKRITFNNKKKSFEITLNKVKLLFPYSKLILKPNDNDKIIKTEIDNEIGGEGFTYFLESGKTDTVHVDAVLDYNKDPDYMIKHILYKITIKAQEYIKKNKINKREIIRRMKTSPTQFYRLLDQSYYNKSIDQMVRLLAALDYKIDVKIEKAA